MKIEPYDPAQRDEIVRLSLCAWAPVFASLEQVLGVELFRALTPDWRAAQRSAVEAACADEAMRVRVACEGSRVAGFSALKLHDEDRMGEVYMIAVDPDFQRRGVATALMADAKEWFRQTGMSVVMVETGGDPGHAPARSLYESVGFRVLPIARYFTKL